MNKKTENKISEELQKIKNERDFLNTIKKNTKKLTDEEIKNGTPLLQLHCIETYSDAPTNREFFTKGYVYHVLGVGRDFINIQTNFRELTATIPMTVISQIFAGFGKQNNKALKIV